MFSSFLDFSSITFCMYVWVNKGSSVLASRGSPLGRILADWSMYCHYPMSKEVLIYYCNTVWPTYVLDCEERWPIHDSLSYCTIMQLKQHCQQLDKSNEIHYVNAYMSLYDRVLPGIENRLMVHRRRKPQNLFLIVRHWKKRRIKR